MKLFKTLLIITFLLLITNLHSQEKLKGNKEITTENRNISNFRAIELIDNVNVNLVSSDSQSVYVETDSNLHQSIVINVINDALTITLKDKILRSKKMEVTVRVNRHFNKINVYNKAKIKSDNILLIDSLTIGAYDNSNIQLKLSSKTIQINGYKNSNLKLDILSNDVLVNAEASNKINAAVNAKSTLINTKDKADVTLKGITENLELYTYGTSNFNGKDFISYITYLNAQNSSDVYINATETIDLLIKNNSEVYLYGNPKISLTEFFDSATLYKKETDRKLF